MNKSYKFLFYIVGFFAIILIVFLIVNGISSKPSGSGTGPGQKLPDYILSQQDEANIKIFVQNFVILYNSYSYQDYSNLTALGDYQTPNLQQKTINLVNQLGQSVPPGFSIRTTVESASFGYSYPQGDRIFAHIQGLATETNTNSGQKISYPVSASLELQKFGSSWQVDVISIEKIQNK